MKENYSRKLVSSRDEFQLKKYIYIFFKNSQIKKKTIKFGTKGNSSEEMSFHRKKNILFI